jgi:replicative DNA helicase
MGIEVLHNLKEQYPRLTDKQLEKLMKVCRDARRRDSGLVSVSDTLLDNFSEIEQRSQGILIPGIPSGFRELDNMTQGFQRSDLILGAARPGLGKTSFVLNIARNITGFQGLPVAIYSLEMSKAQLVYRLLGSEAEISSSRLRAGRINKNEWETISNSIATLSRMPIFIDDTPSPTVTDIKERSRRLQADQGELGCIIIDYLQLMGGGVSENRTQELSQITRSLKNMARELNVPVIALSQLSRGVESRTNKRPMMSDLRDSGALEQDADLIMMLYREDYYDPDTVERGIAEVIITKHRNGPVGTVKLLFEPQFTRFRNLAAP